ncbi:MAG: hypothetical protein CBD16_01450 [Betaproteobacteria bacterium TMED156]|nr:MAG: hypothetical protein CBD16_01450 [Betaproteobacteria bacterium TMED156]|tara:strand:+ start:259 stop:768 length:510 start_codon:yes stop_codon:yes gene_type:complete
MENLFIDTLNFSEWAKSIFKDYLKKNLILDPELPINTKVLLNHRQKHWSSLEYPSEQDISSDIRQYRNSCMLSIMTRDYMNLSSFDENLDSISSLAEICIQTCYEHSVLIESKKFGLPIGKENKYSDLIIIGMGKLGGRELNPSSDIDIIFAHTENGKTAGAKYAKKKY